MDRLYEALREEDSQLRAAAAGARAARHQKILAAVGLVVMIAGMALHHLQQRARPRGRGGGGAREAARSAAAAAALRAAHDVDVRRAEERSRAAAAALQAAHETRITDVKRQGLHVASGEPRSQRLKRANEAWRQLRDKEPVSVSLASVPSGVLFVYAWRRDRSAMERRRVCVVATLPPRHRGDSRTSAGQRHRRDRRRIGPQAPAEGGRAPPERRGQRARPRERNSNAGTASSRATPSRL